MSTIVRLLYLFRSKRATPATQYPYYRPWSREEEDRDSYSIEGEGEILIFTDVSLVEVRRYLGDVDICRRLSVGRPQAFRREAYERGL